MTNLPPITREVPTSAPKPSRVVVDLYNELADQYRALADEKNDDAEVLQECSDRMGDERFFAIFQRFREEEGLPILEAARATLDAAGRQGATTLMNHPHVTSGVSQAVQRALVRPNDFAVGREGDDTVTFTLDHSKVPHDFTEAPENIARTVADIRERRARVNKDFTENGESRSWIHGWSEAANIAEVIDATAIYRSLKDDERSIDMYDRTMAPPFDMFAVCYENEHGNDVVMLNVAIDAATEADADFSMRMRAENIGGKVKEGFAPIADVDWDRVRWQILTTVWCGGSSPTSGPVHTTGPLFIYHSFIYEDGQPADLRWVEVTGTWEAWEMAHLVLLETLSFLSCTNIEVAEPTRPRGQRRRMERESPGVHVKNLMVKQTRKASNNESAQSYTSIGSVPLHTVRGHFSHYGACCPTHEPKGLLFGRLTGKVFVPGHARGSEKHGEIEKTYVPQPESETT